MLAPPSHGKERVTLRMELIAVGCWKLDDIRFAFDSSFVVPEAKPEFDTLSGLREAHPGAPMTIFGHADPTGDENYNKILSGRRARAVYAVLTHNVAMWEQLQTSSEGTGDVWGSAQTQAMLTALGFNQGSPVAAAKAFQTANGLTPDGQAGPKTREKLFAAYFTFLWPVPMTPDEFLGKGADADGKGDRQGCSEFNPQMIFSSAEAQSYQNPAKRQERNAENVVNRRVLALLFRPDTKIGLNRWPCPTTKEGTAGCKQRFWSDAAARLANQEQRRTWASDRNTFGCRFYQRMVEFSPCETPGLPPSQPLTNRVVLRLRYLDPLGEAKDFPKGMPVRVKGPAVDLALTAAESGIVAFDLPLAASAFTLEFAHAGRYVAVATPDTANDEKNRWIGAGEVDAAVKDHYRVFRMPAEWSLTMSDWSRVDGLLYNHETHRFEGILPNGGMMGNDADPVEMVLDPHWQFIRLEYFDRAYGHLAHGSARVAVPALPLQGFRDPRSARGPIANPDTHSNWCVNEIDPATHAQALPWIVQRNAAGGADRRPAPGAWLQLVLAPHTFAVSKDEITRTVETVSDPARRRPGAERMKLYDLPSLWKSTGFRARNAAADRPFEQWTAAELATSMDRERPVAFSLDDLVTVNEDREPVNVVGNNTAAVFSNRFANPANDANLSSEGVYRPHGNSMFPHYPVTSNALTGQRHYIDDYPDWTRAIFADGNVYEAFAERTPDSGGHLRVGARMAVRIVDAVAEGTEPEDTLNTRPEAMHRPFASLKPFEYQESPKLRRGQRSDGVYEEWKDPEGAIPPVLGRYDAVFLRCCDFDGVNEIAMSIAYFRISVKFAESMEGVAFDYAAFRRNLVVNSSRRWNGPEMWARPDGSQFVTNPGDIEILPPADAPHRFRCRPMFFIQFSPKPKAHFLLTLHKQKRATMGSRTGTGNLQLGDESPDPNGRFPAAHEFGHGFGLPDEYSESFGKACSYGFNGYGHYMPGEPFSFLHSGDMMNDAQCINGRNFWHSAEWISRILAIPLEVRAYGARVKFPRHPIPSRTYAGFPLWMELGAEIGERGQTELFLWPLAAEMYSVLLAYPNICDGLLVVQVNIRYRFDDVTTNAEITGPVGAFLQSISANLSKSHFFRGALGPAKFERALVFFSARTLIETLVDDGSPANNAYLDSLGFSRPALGHQSEYESMADDKEDKWVTHFNVRVVKSGTTGWDGDDELRLTAAQLQAPDAWKWFADMVGLAATSRPNPMDAVTKTRVRNLIVRRAVPGAEML